MDLVYKILLILFILDSALLMVVILLQDSKGQGLAGAFGGGGFSTAMFGGRGAATFLSKATTWMGTLFLVLAVIMSIIGPSRRVQQESLIMEAAQQQAVPETGLPLLPGAGQGAAGTTLPTATPPDTGGNGGMNP
jgi:preprotein translocase subunit SecG